MIIQVFAPSGPCFGHHGVQKHIVHASVLARQHLRDSCHEPIFVGKLQLYLLYTGKMVRMVRWLIAFHYKLTPSTASNHRQFGIWPILIPACIVQEFEAEKRLRLLWPFPAPMLAPQPSWLAMIKSDGWGGYPCSPCNPMCPVPKLGAHGLANAGRFGCSLRGMQVTSIIVGCPLAREATSIIIDITIELIFKKINE